MATGIQVEELSRTHYFNHSAHSYRFECLQTKNFPETLYMCFYFYS